MLNRILYKIFGFRIIHSQCGEDLIIDNLLPLKKNGFYVDIGANHPVRCNNTFLFYRKGWTGINIEPNKQKMGLFKLLRHRDTNLNVGVGAEKSTMNLYVFKESTLSTFDKDAADSYIKMGHPLKYTKKVDILPLKEILKTYATGKDIDFLSVDTEGYDLFVLQSNDWNLFRPRFVIIETLEYNTSGLGKKLNSTFDPYMETIGYKKVADTYINTIYEKTH